jgi:hypothetical protein
MQNMTDVSEVLTVSIIRAMSNAREKVGLDIGAGQIR